MRFLILLALLAAGCGSVRTRPALRDGDIIFHTSHSAQSVAIQHATGSRYSHMGLVIHRDGKPFVLEASATVRRTPLDAWIARGVGGHFVVKRIRDATRLLTPEGLARLREEALRFEGLPYDLTFEWSDDRIYCSELVWKAYHRALGLDLGKLQRLREFKLDDPVVRAKLHERYGDRVPLDEPVISPSAMYGSPLLVTVEQR